MIAGRMKPSRPVKTKPHPLMTRPDQVSSWTPIEA